MAVERQITVDGDPADWTGVKENRVQGFDHLWFGQGMTPEKWHGNEELSFSWRSAWFGNRLYFLVEVSDNRLSSCVQEYSWLNDCVEIHLDYLNRGDPRVEGVDVNTPVERRLGKKLRGCETHFLFCSPPRVYLNDVAWVYRLENDQNAAFARDWKGQVQMGWTSTGYLMEIGLSIPGMTLRPGTVMGIDVAVGDDDGQGRKSLMLWTGSKGDFWITMDNFGKMKLIQ